MPGVAGSSPTVVKYGIRDQMLRLTIDVQMKIFNWILFGRPGLVACLSACFSESLKNQVKFMLFQQKINVGVKCDTDAEVNVCIYCLHRANLISEQTLDPFEMAVHSYPTFSALPFRWPGFAESAPM